VKVIKYKGDSDHTKFSFKGNTIRIGDTICVEETDLEQLPMNKFEVLEEKKPERKGKKRGDKSDQSMES